MRRKGIGMGGVAVVTGGSRGLGAACCRKLAASGYDVGFSYVSNDAAAEAVAKDVEAAGRRCLAVKADMAVEADILRFYAEVEEALGAPDVLVNNAGITGKITKLADLSAEDLGRVVDLNVTGAFLVAREAVRRMSTRLGGKGGGIVNVSSTAAKIGSPGEWVHYAATKAAVDTFTLGLAREVATEGMRVNCVAPGLIDTDIHAAAGAPDRVERMAPMIPMQRAGTADEVADAVLWLLSDAASYVTGVVVPVSGGR